MGKSVQKCTLCRMHNVDEVKKDHKAFCKFLTCGCDLCKKVALQREKRKNQTRERRRKATMEKHLSRMAVHASNFDSTQSKLFVCI